MHEFGEKLDYFFLIHSDLCLFSHVYLTELDSKINRIIIIKLFSFAHPMKPKSFSENGSLNKCLSFLLTANLLSLAFCIICYFTYMYFLYRSVSPFQFTMYLVKPQYIIIYVASLQNSTSAKSLVSPTPPQWSRSHSCHLVFHTFSLGLSFFIHQSLGYAEMLSINSWFFCQSLSHSSLLYSGCLIMILFNID